jgi:origin recognition complex subunit 1
MIRINFQPYTTAQLEQIVHARLRGSNEVLSKDAVKFAAMKVSSISGDARRVLDICRCVPQIHLFVKGLLLRECETNADGQ